MQIDGAPLTDPAAPLPELLHAGLVADADAAALVSAVRRLSWRELEDASAALARAYLGRGLQPGDRVASLMPNRLALVVHYLACFKAGLVATPLNYRYTHREIDHALEVSGARALLAHAERAEDLAASARVPRLALGAIAYDDEGAHGFDALLAEGATAATAELPAPDPSSPAAIFFTSGSTGPAKGVTHTHETLCWMIASANAAFALTAAVVEGGWLDSGDLARADEDGYLWFFGRKKQVIVHDGSNVSPLEVESALDEHPAVELAGVVGVHDAVHGENVRAYVTLRAGQERPSSADLIAFCRERVGYKAPEEIIVLDEMPLNPTGKIDRAGLKRLAEDHLHPHGL